MFATHANAQNRKVVCDKELEFVSETLKFTTKEPPQFNNRRILTERDEQILNNEIEALREKTKIQEQRIYALEKQMDEMLMLKGYLELKGVIQ